MATPLRLSIVIIAAAGAVAVTYLVPKRADLFDEVPGWVARVLLVIAIVVVAISALRSISP